MILYILTWLQSRMDRRALTSLEFGLIGGVIVATVVVGFRLLANNASTKFSSIGGSL